VRDGWPRWRTLLRKAAAEPPHSKEAGKPEGTEEGKGEERSFVAVLL
jgi:hypothetical protein